MEVFSSVVDVNVVAVQKGLDVVEVGIGLVDGIKSIDDTLVSSLSSAGNSEVFLWVRSWGSWSNTEGGWGNWSNESDSGGWGNQAWEDNGCGSSLGGGSWGESVWS